MGKMIMEHLQSEKNIALSLPIKTNHIQQHPELEINFSKIHEKESMEQARNTSFFN